MSRVISSRISDDLADKLHETAVKEGMTDSEFIKQSVRWTLILKGVKLQ